MGASGLSWQVAFITAPLVGGAVLGAEPFALWPGVVLVAIVAGLASLRFERALPPAPRLTQRRLPVARAVADRAPAESAQPVRR
jgi:MFS family permease